MTCEDKEQVKQQGRLQWMRSLRDVYRKYLHKAGMPFFYVKNASFCALFMRDQDQRPVVVLNPNKTLATLIHDLGIQKVV